MKRKIYEKLLEWKQRDARKVALLIDGARRVGKSWIAEEFGKNEYESHLLIDFRLAGDEVKEMFRTQLDRLDDFFFNLSAYYNVRLVKGRSLIIFDEIQFFPRAREAIKWLVKDGRFDYLETGSLVSIDENVKDIQVPSEERRIDLGPMDWEEFLWAICWKPSAGRTRRARRRRTRFTGARWSLFGSIWSWAGCHRPSACSWRNATLLRSIGRSATSSTSIATTSQSTPVAWQGKSGRYSTAYRRS